MTLTRLDLESCAAPNGAMRRSSVPKPLQMFLSPVRGVCARKSESPALCIL